jgi:hypothetical protein
MLNSQGSLNRLGANLRNPYGPSAASLNLDFTASNTLDSRISFTRATTATYFNSSGVLSTAASGEARFDYNPTTLAPQGLLIEEQRTNSIRNNTMVGAVAGTPGTNPTNWDITVSPSGITTEIVGTGVEDGITYIDVRYFGTGSGSASPQIRPETTTGIVAAAGQTWTASYYLRIVGGSTTGLSAFSQIWQERDAAGVALNTVTVTISAPTTAALKTQRSILTRTLTDAGTARLTNRIQWTFTNGVAVDITLRIGLPQLELGAFATSVIPTTTTALTRNADAASMTGTNFSDWYNAVEGTLYVEANTPDFAVAYVFADINSNSLTNYIRQSTSSLGTISQFVVSDSGTAVASPGVSVTLGSVRKAAGAYILNSIQQSVNGSLGTQDTSATIPAGLTQLNIGSRSTGANNVNGTIRRIAYYPVRLANTTLQALTA